MRRLSPVAASIVAMLPVALLPATARTDDEPIMGPTQCAGSECPAGSPHAGLELGCPGGQFPDQATVACQCWNQCGGGAGGGNGGAAVEGAAEVLAGVVLALVMPGVLLEQAMSPEEVDQEAKQAEKDWQDTLDGIRAREDAGNRAIQAQAQMDARLAELRDAPDDPATAAAAKGYRPVPKPRLEPSLQYECDQAGVLGPDQDGGPIAIWPTEEAMLKACMPLLEKPAPAKPAAQCGPGDFKSVVPGSPERTACCPNGYPYYDACDSLCFPSSDFRAAPDAPGRHCGQSIDFVTRP